MKKYIWTFIAIIPLMVYGSLPEKLEEKIDKEKLNQLRGQIRSQIKGQSRQSKLKSVPRWNDQVNMMMEGRKVIFNLHQLESLNIKKKTVRDLPWSDHYWPIKEGILGARYADRDFLNLERFDDCLNYINSNPATEIFESKEERRIDQLSPAEKYDLLLGPKSELSLTIKMWEEGKRYFDRYGKVEGWMGICHGWAPASFMEQRPINAIKVKAHNGETNITFYPSDIKALASLLWAKSRYETLFVGGRCNDKLDDQSDEDRLSPDCQDTNPATWHLTVLNKLGRFQESFIIDATFDYEVWNQPMVSYQFEYFNPKDRENHLELEKNIVSLDKFDNDKHRAHRAPRTKSVIGVQMTITYGAENRPNQRTADDSSYDWHNRASYQYDLELDENNNIIGGEWYHHEHPDFLWSPAKNAIAKSPGDIDLNNIELWDGQTPLNQRWKNAAVKSNYLGLPLEHLVKSLINLSRLE